MTPQRQLFERTRLFITGRNMMWQLHSMHRIYHFIALRSIFGYDELMTLDNRLSINHLFVHENAIRPFTTPHNNNLLWIEFK